MTVDAWQCIGCGRIEAPQTCVGICEYHKVQLVYAGDLDDLRAETRAARREADILGALVRRLAHTSPHPGEWERSWKAMQQHARRALQEAEAGTGEPSANPPSIASARE